MGKTIVNELYRVVCNTEARKKEFIKLFFSHDPNRMSLDLLSYRDYQLQQGRGQNITAEQLKQARNDDELRKLLSELFVFPVTSGVTKTIRKYNIAFDDLIAEHKNDPYCVIRRILHIIIEKKYKVA